MTKRKKNEEADTPVDPLAHQQPRSTDAAFDKWLYRGLHELFDDVMKEPVPPELLKIVRDDETE